MSSSSDHASALPSRWQVDVLVYEEVSPYPMLLLQPGRHDDHQQLVRLLRQGCLAQPTAWEWDRGLWPLTTGCTVELFAHPPSVSVWVNRHRLTVGLRPTGPPAQWLLAAYQQRQVLFALLPPSRDAREDMLIVEDVSKLEPAQRRGCLAGCIPFAGP